MRYLLDTQCWLWLQTSPEKIDSKSLKKLENQDTEPILSAASCWEIAIKFAIGKLPLPEPPETYVPKRIASSGVRSLDVKPSHALRVSDLPMHHSDPFDRLLVAQAQLEKLTIMTTDRKFEPYKVKVHWVG